MNILAYLFVESHCMSRKENHFPEQSSIAWCILKQLSGCNHGFEGHISQMWMVFSGFSLFVWSTQALQTLHYLVGGWLLEIRKHLFFSWFDISHVMCWSMVALCGGNHDFHQLDCKLSCRWNEKIHYQLKVVTTHHLRKQLSWI